MKKVGHKFVLSLYVKVNDYLANSREDHERLADIIVCFCTVVEKTIKIKLYEKNPVLVFDVSKLKNNESLTAVVSNKEKDIETIRMSDVIARAKIIYPDIFSDEEIQALFDVCSVRNNLLHGYKEDSDILIDSDNLVKKMGTVWEKFSKQAIAIFGKDNIKHSIPKRKYSEHELENVLIEEVKKKIQSKDDSLVIRSSLYPDRILPISSIAAYSVMGGEKCPRCGTYGFSLDSSQINSEYLVATASVLGNYSNLYKCKRCDLELTQKEFDIAKKIIAGQ